MSAFCALCLDPIIGNPRQQPLGRNDALVNVCTTCDSAHPRSGRYSFDDASKCSGRTASHMHRQGSTVGKRGRS